MPELPRLKFLGLDVPLTKPGLNLLGVIIALGVGLFIYVKVWDQPEAQVLTLKEANERQAAEIEEYAVHAMEEPQKHELLEDPDGALGIRIFKDHCVMIQRQTSRGIRTKLVIDLARDARSHHQVDSLWLNPFEATVLAQSRCNGGCLINHPGIPSWRYGVRQGDWVEVIRWWPDGCTHVQLYNVRTGYWDTNPNGTPRVRWTCCVH